MTADEFNNEINRLKLVLPNFAASLKLIDDLDNPIAPDQKNAVARFWFSKLENFPVSAFRIGYEKAALQRNVFPNFADILEYTKEAVSSALNEPQEEPLMLPAGKVADTIKYYDNAVYIQPRATEAEVEDKVHEQMVLLNRLRFVCTKITRTQGIARQEHIQEYKLNIEPGMKCYTALMIFVGSSTSDWEALGKSHNMDYKWTKEHARVREEEGSDPGNQMAESFARMRASVYKAMGIPDGPE